MPLIFYKTHTTVLQTQLFLAHCPYKTIQRYKRAATTFWEWTMEVESIWVPLNILEMVPSILSLHHLSFDFLFSWARGDINSSIPYSKELHNPFFVREQILSWSRPFWRWKSSSWERDSESCKSCWKRHKFTWPCRWYCTKHGRGISPWLFTEICNPRRPLPLICSYQTHIPPLSSRLIQFQALIVTLAIWALPLSCSLSSPAP